MFSKTNLSKYGFGASSVDINTNHVILFITTALFNKTIIQSVSLNVKELMFSHCKKGKVMHCKVMYVDDCDGFFFKLSMACHYKDD